MATSYKILGQAHLTTTSDTPYLYCSICPPRRLFRRWLLRTFRRVRRRLISLCVMRVRLSLTRRISLKRFRLLPTIQLPSLWVWRWRRLMLLQWRRGRRMLCRLTCSVLKSTFRGLSCLSADCLRLPWRNKPDTPLCLPGHLSTLMLSI